MSLFPSLSNFTARRREQEQERVHHAMTEEFKTKLAELEHIGRQLHEAGHYIDIDYTSPHVARHGRNGSTLFFNNHLNSARTIRISKNPNNPNRK